MAEKVIINKSILTDIGNAIREKEESSDLIPSTEMATRIRDFQGGAKIVSAGVEKILKGEYNGDSVSITKPENVDISALIDEQKIPLAVNVDIPTYDGGYENGTQGDRLKKLLDETKSCMYLFYEYTGKSVDHLISYDDTENVENINYMCYKAKTLLHAPNINTSNVKEMVYVCYECNKLMEIPKYDTRNVSTLNSAFYNCYYAEGTIELDISNVTNLTKAFFHCEKVSKIILSNTSKVVYMTSAFEYCLSATDIGNLNMINVNTSSIGNVFYGCRNLTNLILYNIKQSLIIGSGSSWGHLLTVDSLINTIKELIDTGSSRTLTIGSANLAKIENVYVRLTGEAEEDEANPKYPCEVCESTDEGAMTIIAYANSKNWTIA